MKKIITTTGFYNTGSTAITHIMSEFDCVENNSGIYELRILYDPDCISDLEYNLVENPHRQNTSNAIKRFKKYIIFNSSKLTNYHYERLCDKHFREISFDYINDIIDFNYLGASHIDVYERGKLFWIINRIYKKIVNFICGYHLPRFIHGTLMRPQIQYAGSSNYLKFLEATQKYVSKLLNYLNKSGKNIIMIDQFFPPTNVDRYMKYIPDEYEVKTFIVDRDPRDLFVLCKYLENAQTIPCQTPEIFCDWYLWTRGQSLKQPDSSNFMRIRFEDLIYQYEETRKKIIEFCGFVDLKCNRKLQIFNPQLSINNTQVWNRYPESKNEIQYITDRLKDYCYDYESFELKPDFINGNVFEC